jgi:hypothetical protein
VHFLIRLDGQVVGVQSVMRTLSRRGAPAELVRLTLDRARLVRPDWTLTATGSSASPAPRPSMSGTPALFALEETALRSHSPVGPGAQPRSTPRAKVSQREGSPVW